MTLEFNPFDVIYESSQLVTRFNITIISSQSLRNSTFNIKVFNYLSSICQKHSPNPVTTKMSSRIKSSQIVCRPFV